ncbi:MAG: zinc ribbon domain-containing protein [Arenicella sp.]|nr:zinc ribbon domain-containing protein [Arenicella sp.]
MPIYQYKCTDCGQGLEALQKMSDAKLVDCPECNTPTLKKQLTAAVFKLKGTGWYETDSKNLGKKPEEKKAETKSESKPPSSPESKSSASAE